MSFTAESEVRINLAVDPTAWDVEDFFAQSQENGASIYTHFTEEGDDLSVTILSDAPANVIAALFGAIANVLRQSVAEQVAVDLQGPTDDNPVQEVDGE